MKVIIAILYLIAAVLVFLAAFGVPARISLALTGAGCALLAFSLPAIQAGLTG